MELIDSSSLDISQIRDQRNWVAEINELATLIDRLDSLNKVTSTRELSKAINKSKSWIGVSILLVKGLKLYPEIEKLHSRNQAYEYVQKKLGR